MPTKNLPAQPSLDHLKNQARDLRRDHLSRSPQAAQRLREFLACFRDAADESIFDSPLPATLAQQCIAHEYGFASWARLRRFVLTEPKGQQELPYHERITDSTFREAVRLLDLGDVQGLSALLAQHPELAYRRVTFEGGNYFRNPSLLEFIAENPVRHGSLPANIGDVALIIIQAGASVESRTAALTLVASGRVPRESGVQKALIEVLCTHGADPAQGLMAAMYHGEEEAVEALLKRGAPVNLILAAARGDTSAFDRLIGESSPAERHTALSIASQNGHAPIVKRLLSLGESPRQYNPVEFHAHATPLHLAAWEGHLEVVRMLVEAGADIDAKDLLWQGTPLGWAKHGDRSDVRDYLEGLDDGRCWPG